MLNNCIALLEKLSSVVLPQRTPFGARLVDLTSPNCQCIRQTPLTPPSSKPESVVLQTQVAHNAVAASSSSPFTPVASNPNTLVPTPDSGFQGSTTDCLCLTFHSPTNACTNYKSAFKPVVPRKVRMQCNNAVTPDTHRQSMCRIPPFGNPPFCLPTQVNSTPREMVLPIRAPLYCDRPVPSSTSSSRGYDGVVQMPLDLSCRPRMNRHS